LQLASLFFNSHTLFFNSNFFSVFRDHIISSHAIYRRNYFRTVVGWFRAPFVLKIVRFPSIWKPRLKSQNIPFIYKECVGGFFYIKVITSRNRMQTYDMIPYLTCVTLYEKKTTSFWSNLKISNGHLHLDWHTYKLVRCSWNTIFYFISNSFNPIDEQLLKMYSLFSFILLK